MIRTIALNPTSAPPPPEALGVRLESLRGARVGFFSNNKPNADVLLRRTASALEAQLGVAPLFFTKDIPSLEASAALLAQVREGCDAVVLAALD